MSTDTAQTEPTLAALHAELAQERAARVQAEEACAALRISETHFRHITEYALDLITIMGPDGKIRFESRSIEKVLGYPPEEYEGKDAFSFVHPDDLPGVAHAFLEALQQHGNTPVLSFRFRHRNGSYRVLEGCGNNLLSDPAVCGMIFNSRDITERVEAEAELARLNSELVETSRKAGMAEVANGVLHNVGNVVNSVNVAAGMVHQRLEKSRLKRLRSAVGLLQEHREDLAAFITQNPKGQMLFPFLEELAVHLEKENQELRGEMESITRHVEHLRQIILAQQTCARSGGTLEALQPETLIDQALQLCTDAIKGRDVAVQRQMESKMAVMADRHRVLQILVNLIRNAVQSIDEAKPAVRRIVIRLAETGSDRFGISVQDTGIGIAPETLAKIFRHGFTTKKEGHGFGLHSSMAAAREMKGELKVESEGLGLGATFTLELPVDRANSAKADPAPTARAA